MTQWNHDISAAPRGKMVPITRATNNGPKVTDEFRREYILAVHSDGDVVQSYWIAARYTTEGNLLDGGRWSGFNRGADPIAWAPWPTYEFSETQRQQGTDGGEIAEVKGNARLANAIGVEPSSSEHFHLDDAGSGA